MDSQIRRTYFTQAQFTECRYKLVSADSYIAYLRGKRCQTEEDFFCEISSSMQFPYYFGMNWAALDDCLCDLDWLLFSKIIIMIDNYGEMFGGDDQTKNRLLRYFGYMIEYWEKEGKKVEIWLND